MKGTSRTTHLYLGRRVAPSWGYLEDKRRLQNPDWPLVQQEGEPDEPRRWRRRRNISGDQGPPSLWGTPRTTQLVRDTKDHPACEGHQGPPSLWGTPRTTQLVRDTKDHPACEGHQGPPSLWGTPRTTQLVRDTKDHPACEGHQGPPSLWGTPRTTQLVRDTKDHPACEARAGGRDNKCHYLPTIRTITSNYYDMNVQQITLS